MNAFLFVLGTVLLVVVLTALFVWSAAKERVDRFVDALDEQLHQLLGKEKPKGQN